MTDMRSVKSIRPAWLDRLYRASVWHPTADEPGAEEYRDIKRVWLPVFDLISILVGILAISYGSILLNELYDRASIEIIGSIFLGASIVALIGVSFPKLWLPEATAKIIMFSLLGGYSALIWTSFFAGNVYSGFVAAVLIYPILLPAIRLTMIGKGLRKKRDQ